MNHRILSILLLTVISVTVFAAGKPAKTFSGKYQNKPVKEVLADMKKECGVSVRLQKKVVSSSRKVTVSFRNDTPEEVLEKLFDCEYVITQGKRKNSYQVSKRDLTPKSTIIGTYRRDTILFDTRVASREEVEALHAVILHKESRSRVSIEDSVLTTTDRIEHRTQEGKVVRDTTPDYRHSLQAYLGGAYTSLGYSLQGGKNLGGWGGEVSLRYAYFFTPEWGLGFGVDYDTYQSYGRLNTTHRWDHQIDSEGEGYNHLALTHDWTEQQRIHEISVPVVAEYQHRFASGNGIFCALGAYAGMPLATGYRLSSGSLEHQGEYPQWGMIVDGVGGHDFYTEQVGENFSKERKSVELQKVTFGLKADLGAIIPVASNVDLFAGVYAKAEVLDISTKEKTPMGWRQPEASEDYRRHNFMPEYVGMLASDETGAVRPYEVGVKIGVHFRPGAKPKNKKSPAETLCFVVTDSTYSSVLRYDTLLSLSTDTVASLRRTLQKSVIWFAVNDYEHPRLHPSDLLEQVAEILIAQPDQRIAINGHASAEGNARANQLLSDRRAATIANRLIQLGVPASQIVTSGLSSRVNYVRSDTEDASAATGRSAAELNRRVEIIPL